MSSDPRDLINRLRAAGSPKEPATPELWNEAADLIEELTEYITVVSWRQGQLVGILSNAESMANKCHPDAIRKAAMDTVMMRREAAKKP